MLKLEQQNTMFELELLRSKINPHFLYNVHNSIAGLISKDPVKAEAMILLLSKFFRFTLNKESATFHSIADEIDIIRTYLDLQLIRYGDRLNYTINVDQSMLALQLPSYILQPLVENSIKHGIEKITEKGVIAIEITVANDQLIIRVIDNGPAFPNLPGTGNGLQIINNKLRLLYQERFTIEFQNFPKKYVELILPQNHPDGISR
jgi:two-component system LytT family sensor kinase